MRDIQDTYGRRIFFINNNERVQITTPTPETRTPLQPKDSEFHCSKDFCIKSTSMTLLSKSISNTLPKACIYMDENKAVSKVEEVETVKKIKLNRLTNLK